MINFYLFHTDKKIVVSDYPVERVKKKYGYKFEILNSIKDLTAQDLVIERIKRQYPLFSVAFYKKRPSTKLSEEVKKKISLSKIGKPRDEATRKKISATMKGKSNFHGKKHRQESKEKIAAKFYGNKNVAGTHWVHDPRGDTEKRVRDRTNIPKGFSLGRDYYSTEAGVYHFRKKKFMSE